VEEFYQCPEVSQQCKEDYLKVSSIDNLVVDTDSEYQTTNCGINSSAILSKYIAMEEKLTKIEYKEQIPKWNFHPKLRTTVRYNMRTLAQYKRTIAKQIST